MSTGTRQRSLTIIVSGMIAAVPSQGGSTWAVLQYLLGLRRLGHDVYFVEELSASSLTPRGSALGRSANAGYFNIVTSRFNLQQHAALLHSMGDTQTIGLPFDRLLKVAREADVLINIAGMLRNEEITSNIPIRLYLDLDPVFTQMWQAVDGIDMGFADHTHFATVGLNIGKGSCPVPDCGKPWITTLPPVVLDHWSIADQAARGPFTTIANWRGYGSVEHEGVFYGQQVHSWRKFMELPESTGQSFTVALAIHPDETSDLQLLSANGWDIVDPENTVGSPKAYQRFIQSSRAEIGITKSGYVTAHSGWFSDRSACYLASGRPVVAQDTGFSETLPTGRGLLSFTTQDEALAAVEAIDKDYLCHSSAARRVAEEYFDSDIVLSTLLQRIGATG